MFCYKIIGDVLNFSGRKKLRLLLCLFPRSHAPAWERDDDKFSRSQAGGKTEKKMRHRDIKEKIRFICG